MSLPPHVESSRVTMLHELMRERPLATLVALHSSGLDATQIVLHLDARAGPYGTLRGHLARSNPAAATLLPAVEALVLFNGAPPPVPQPAARGSAQRYVIQTADSVVRARGTLRVIEDPAWLRHHLQALTVYDESSGGAPCPVSQLPPEFINQLATAIVGVELRIDHVSGPHGATPVPTPPCRPADPPLALDDERSALEIAALVEARLLIARAQHRSR